MEQEALEKRVLHLREVEKLSLRQIARVLAVDRKRVRRILKRQSAGPTPIEKKSLLDPYQHLMANWYQEYPHLKATQIYERLKSYGYGGSYVSVARRTESFRRIKRPAYHTLEFVRGEEAQVDWFFFNHPRLGKVAGFVYVLAWSRYAWGKFYPRTSLEFLLAGHLECFHHLQGLAHRHRYDNMKTILLGRDPTIQYHPAFLDFARFFGFSMHICNPYAGNEKGRVERVGRDLRIFLASETFENLADLNRQFHRWLELRNEKIHRATGKSPKELLAQEHLLALPQGAYPPTRTLPALASKTALVEFDTNRYSVPSGCASKKLNLVAFPEKIEIHLGSNRVAVHPRCFARKQIIQNPLHAEKLLNRSPHFKYERILQLLRRMDPAFEHFLNQQEDPSRQLQVAYELFQLLKSHSRALLISAVRELNQMGAFKVRALRSLLNLPTPKEGEPVWPHNSDLLKLDYPPRRLQDYDPAP